MANFPPLKRYLYYWIDQLINEYDLSPPFLDAGCGSGDISLYLALRGWHGKAIDFSDIAIDEATHILSPFTSVKTEKKSLFHETSSFNTILFLDVLEHINNDVEALEKISSLLNVNGHAIIVVPSNPIEWRWDDDFYGHVRRYTAQEIRAKLISVGLNPVVMWDCTYPFFWIMRRIYTGLKKEKKTARRDKEYATIVSSSVNAWDFPFIAKLMSRNFIFWNLIYKIQFKYFKDKTSRGHEMVVLAKKGK